MFVFCLKKFFFAYSFIFIGVLLVLVVVLVAKPCSTLVIPRTVTCQAPLFMGFSRQEYWSELPFPSPGDLPDPGINPGSPALQADSLLTELFLKNQLLNEYSGLISFKTDWFDYVLCIYVT